MHYFQYVYHIKIEKYKSIVYQPYINTLTIMIFVLSNIIFVLFI